MSDSRSSLSRRRFIAWVGAGAAAGAGGWAGLSATRDGDDVGLAADLLFSDPYRGPQREVRTLHFALGRAEEFHTGLHLIVGGTRADLVPHDDRSRRRLAIRNPIAARTDLSQFTHMAPQINVPTTRPIETLLYGTDRETGEEVIFGGALLHPTWAMRRVVLAAHRLGVLQEHYAQHPMVRALGIAPEAAPANPVEALAIETLLDNATAIAQKIVFKHPSIMNMDPETASITSQIVNGTPIIDGLVTAVQTLLDNVGVYGQLLPQISATGGHQTLDPPGGPPGSGPPVSSFQPFMLDGTQYKGQPISTDWTSAFRQNTSQTVSAVINQVKDDISLDGKAWVQTTGTAPTTQPVTPPNPPPEPGPEVTTTTAAVTTTTAPPPSPTPTFSIDDSWNKGTKMEIQSVTTQSIPDPTPTDPNHTVNVPVITVRVFNNNEKVYDLYAQFFNADQTQLAGPEGPQTGDLAQPFGSTLYGAPTILGIPLFGQNWVDYVVTFPGNATEARLLLATMGGLSGWQQNLVDASGNQLYPGSVFPPECKNAVIWTTVLNLALPTVMLAMDIIAIASFFTEILTVAGGVTREVLIEQVATYFKFIKAAAGIAGIASMLEGSSQSADFGGPNKPSMVSVILEFGLGLIGLLAIPLLQPILTLILTTAGVEEPEKALPIVGEVLMVISAAADAAVLGQTIGEVANDTWVTTRSLTGVYDATVTVQPDPRSTTFPPAAVSWTLTPHLSKTNSLTAVTNSEPFQQSGPVSGNLTIPVPNVSFGGTIRYSIAMLDENGWTVGAGNSGWLDNFDPTNLPVPTFNITESGPPVSAGSSFNRRWTSQFDSTASTYSWSTAATIPGTIADQQTCDAPDDICRAGSIAIGTATGFIGYTYQTTQGWFVRQLGFSETPGTGAQSIATPFPAQPLVLYDSISHDPANGHNFLLEPITGANAYHVRQLDLTSAGLGLDTSTSWGIFLDTIHGVVMHPAGFLIGFNTDSGKLHVLQLPDAGMDEAIAPAATMHAGTGNATGERPGLTQRPVSLAVALNGMVLALEQAAARIQAFDVRGNPTQYFSANGVANTSYYLPLVAQNTYLGMSVDGAGFVYTLSYSDDGSDPSQYGVDVYQPTGEHIFRGSGVNGANFVVDYWRNAYTQNFTAVQQTSGGTYITPQGIAEPSTSVWIPDTPNPGGGG